MSYWCGWSSIPTNWRRIYARIQSECSRKRIRKEIKHTFGELMLLRYSTRGGPQNRRPKVPTGRWIMSLRRSFCAFCISRIIILSLVNMSPLYHRMKSFQPPLFSSRQQLEQSHPRSLTFSPRYSKHQIASLDPERYFLGRVTGIGKGTPRMERRRRKQRGLKRHSNDSGIICCLLWW